MKCARCGAAGRPDARYCPECGGALHAVCRACGAAARAGEKYCSTCGAPLRGPAPDATADHLASPLADRLVAFHTALEGERKQVTVLFADLRGSLELLGERDPEEARRLLDPVLHRMVEAVRRYEGTVNQVMGDGIMALFGAPVAQEDHAVRACLAALDMHAGISREATALTPGGDLDLRIRIGLNSGEVVVRFVDSDLRLEYTAVGKTTHVAARMEQSAVPGTTLITGATRRLAAGYVEVRPVGPVAVKGLAAPVEAYELVGVTPESARRETARSRWATRFVGRLLELAELRQACDRTAAGHGQVVAVVGEPGIGKSRLVSELTRSHLPTGWLVLETGAVPHAQAAAYLPFVGLLRAYFGVRDGDGPAEVRERVSARLAALPGPPAPILPPLLELLGVPAEDAAWQALEPAGRGRAVLDAVCQLLVRHSRSQPLLVVVEDLQGIDSETQALLDRLVARLPSERILLLVTYRPEYTHGWSSLGHYAQLPVVPLARGDAEQLLQELLGTGPELVALVSLLLDRAVGNPLFLEASVSDLVEAQVLVGTPGAYRLERAVTTLNVPSTVQAVLAARIDRLPEQDRWLLQCAAASGRDVPVALLVAITDVGADEVAAGLDRLRSRGFLYESAFAPAPAFAFGHVLTLEVALGSLLSDTRRTLDARIVAALERLYPDQLDEHVERLAHHTVRGEVWDKAVRYCRAAGLRAASRSAHRVAADYFERALGALAHLPQTAAAIEEAIDIRLELRSALVPLGQYRRTVGYLQEAQALARTLGDERRLGIINSHLANYLHLTGQLAGAAEQAEQALAIAARLGDMPLRIVSTAYLAFTHHTLGRYREAADLARRNVADLSGAHETERFGMTSLPAVYSRTCLAWALAELGEFAEADRVGREALEVAERAQHSYTTVYACLARGIVYLRRGDFADAAGLLERAAHLCRALEMPVLLAMITVPLASAYAHDGKVADAVRVLGEAGEEARRIRDPIGHWVRTGALAEAYLLAGRAAEAQPLALEYLAQRRAIGARGYEAWALHLLADVTAALGPGAREQARALYREAGELAGRLEMRPLVARCQLGLGRLERWLERREQGAAALAAAASLFESMGMGFWRARAERELGAGD